MTSFAAALICAAQLMAYEGPLPEILLWLEAPSADVCSRTGTPDACAAVTSPTSYGGIVVVIAGDAPFDLQVHEAVHVLQLHLHLPYPDHDTVHRLVARRGECPAEASLRLGEPI